MIRRIVLFTALSSLSAFSFVPQGVSTNNPDNGPAIEAAMVAAGPTGCRIEFDPGVYELQSAVNIPHYAQADWQIELGGAKLYKTTPGPAFISTATNQAEAGMIQSRRLSIHGGQAFGAGWTNQTFLDLGAIHLKLNDVLIQNWGTGVVTRFSLFGTYRDCRFINNRCCDVSLENGNWEGASQYNSQCNGALFEQCEFFALAGEPFQVGIFGSSAVTFFHDFFEGGNPQYMVYYDTGGSTTVNGYTMTACYFESVPSKAMFYFGGSGSFVWDTMELHNYGSFGNFTNCNSAARFIIRNAPNWQYLPAGCMQNPNPSVNFFEFQNVGSGVSLRDPKWWAGGVPLNAWSDEYRGNPNPGVVRQAKVTKLGNYDSTNAVANSGLVELVGSSSMACENDDVSVWGKVWNARLGRPREINVGTGGGNFAGRVTLSNSVASFASNGLPAVAVALPCSPSAWTNTSGRNGFLFLSGGQVLGVSLNGAALPVPPAGGQISMQPGEWVVITNSAPPTAAWKPL